MAFTLRIPTRSVSAPAKCYSATRIERPASIWLELSARSEAMPGTTAGVHARPVTGPGSISGPRRLGRFWVNASIPEYMQALLLEGSARPLQVLLAARRVQRLATHELQTTIRMRVPLSAVRQAIKAYNANPTAGKVLLMADSALSLTPLRSALSSG